MYKKITFSFDELVGVESLDTKLPSPVAGCQQQPLCWAFVSLIRSASCRAVNQRPRTSENRVLAVSMPSQKGQHGSVAIVEHGTWCLKA